MLKRPTTASPDWLVAPGLTDYDQAIATMQARIAGIRDGAAPELIWLVEHPPLYTAGTSAHAEDLQEPERFPTYQAGRGGQWTYHGPGQLVAYVMLDLTRPHASVPPRDTHAFVAGLENWLIATIGRFGVTGERRPGRVGIWVVDETTGAESKIAAIGVRITRWVSWHGVSLNVCPDLAHFGGIVPCGIREHGVTSLRALGVAADPRAVAVAMRACWSQAFG